MASDEVGTAGSRPGGKDNRHSRLPDSPTPRLAVDGHTFWRTDAHGRSIELTTATGIELDGQRCRWTVSAPGARVTGEGIESGSREVRRFMNGVLGAMQRATHRATVRPAPKPRPRPAPAIPATAPVPCPLCAGEAWPDCEVCDGTGIVTARQAVAWQDGTWSRDEERD